MGENTSVTQKYAAGTQSLRKDLKILGTWSNNMSLAAVDSAGHRLERRTSPYKQVDKNKALSHSNTQRVKMHNTKKYGHKHHFGPINKAHDTATATNKRSLSWTFRSDIDLVILSWCVFLQKYENKIFIHTALLTKMKNGVKLINKWATRINYSALPPGPFPELAAIALCRDRTLAVASTILGQISCRNTVSSGLQHSDRWSERCSANM